MRLGGEEKPPDGLETRGTDNRVKPQQQQIGFRYKRCIRKYSGTGVNAWTCGLDPLYGPRVHFSSWPVPLPSAHPGSRSAWRGQEGLWSAKGSGDGSALVLQRHCLGFEVFI